MIKLVRNWTPAKTFWLSLMTTISLFIVNTVGFVDTMTKSTQGCGKSWPLCNGSIEPWNWDYHAWIEFGHRFLVFAASVLLVTLSVVVWRQYGRERRIRLMIMVALGGVAVESLLGALSVFSINPPLLMAAHMGVALLSFGSLVVLTVTIRDMQQSRREARQAVGKPLSRLIGFSFFYLYAAIYFGAYVASTGSGVYFRGFPFPTESYAWADSALLIDIAHRIFALGLLVLTLLILLWTRKLKAQRPDLYAAGLLSFILVCLQGLSGALLIYTQLSLSSILVHVTIVSLLFADICYLGIQSLPQTGNSVVKRQKRPVQSTHAASRL